MLKRSDDIKFHLKDVYQHVLTSFKVKDCTHVKLCQRISHVCNWSLLRLINRLDFI